MVDLGLKFVVMIEVTWRAILLFITKALKRGALYPVFIINQVHIIEGHKALGIFAGSLFLCYSLGGLNIL